MNLLKSEHDDNVTIYFLIFISNSSMASDLSEKSESKYSQGFSSLNQSWGH